jgi:hypothetical protein
MTTTTGRGETLMHLGSKKSARSQNSVASFKLGRKERKGREAREE